MMHVVLLQSSQIFANFFLNLGSNFNYKIAHFAMYVEIHQVVLV